MIRAASEATMRRRSPMPSRLAAVLLAAACLPPALVPVNATAQATISPEHEIVLSTGRGELVEVPGG